jgi:three-Cys-motif partner protein
VNLKTNEGTVHEFGGKWTELKLDAMRRYFSAYATVLKKQSFRKVYIDAFAGTGERTEKERLEEPENDIFGESDGAYYQATKVGSTRIALEIDPPFSEYKFIELKAGHVQALNALKGEYPHRNIEVLQGDANAVLTHIARSTLWNTYPYVRAAVFVDPYGMNIDWETLVALAETKAVDLVLLFPTGPLNRMLTRDGDIPEAWQKRIDQTLGTPRWRNVFYADIDIPDMFDTDRRRAKTATLQGLKAIAIERLQTVFPWALNESLELRNSKGSVLYDLLFACANPKKVAGEKCLNIARSAIKVGKNGGTI